MKRAWLLLPVALVSPAGQTGVEARTTSPDQIFIHTDPPSSLRQVLSASAVPASLTSDYLCVRPVTFLTYVYSLGQVRATDGPGFSQQIDQSLLASFDYAQRLLSQAGNVSGYRSRFRVACDANGQPLIYRKTLSTTMANTTFNSIVADMRGQLLLGAKYNFQAGLDKALTLCNGFGGLGSYVPNSSFGINNPNNSGGHMAVACYDPNQAISDEIVAHEMLHTLGAVQSDAPNSDGNSHCNQGADVMCQAGTLCPTLTLDCNKDDYFRPTPPLGSYLFKNFNIGAGYNRFVSNSPGTRSITDPFGRELAASGAATDTVTARIGRISARISCSGSGTVVVRLKSPAGWVLSQSEPTPCLPTQFFDVATVAGDAFQNGSWSITISEVAGAPISYTSVITHE